MVRKMFYDCEGRGPPVSPRRLPGGGAFPRQPAASAKSKTRCKSQEGTKLSPRPTTSIQDPFSSLECMQGFVITWPALSMESKHAMHTNTVAPIRLRLPPLTAHRSRLSRPSASPLDAVP